MALNTRVRGTIRSSRSALTDFIRDPRTGIANRPRAASAVGGGLLALAFPPRDWWWAAVLGIAVFALALSPGERRARTRRGLAFGFGFGLTAIALIWRPEVPILVVLAEVLAAGLFALFFAGLAALVPPGRWTVVGLPAAWVVVDGVLARWPFGGLPLVGVAAGQAAGPIAQVARFGGQAGVVAMATLAGAAIAAWWLLPRRRVAAALAGVVVAAVVIAPLVPRGQPVGSIETVLVQGGGDRGVAATPYAVTYQLHREALREVEAGVDLVVLPEGTAHVRDDEEPFEFEELARAAERLDTTLVAGVVERVTAEDRFLNSAFVWTGDEGFVGRYDKVHGVPFAEYIPGRSWLGSIVDLSLVPRDIKEGDHLEPVDSPAGRLGILVSFEVFFPGLARDVVREGAEVVLVPTNAGSFTDGQVPWFEIAASRLRAIETGRWVLQVTPTGFSAVVDPSGRVVARTGLGSDREFLRETIELRTGRTPFAVVGEWPVLVLAGAALAFAWWRVKGAQPNG